MLTIDEFSLVCYGRRVKQEGEIQVYTTQNELLGDSNDSAMIGEAVKADIRRVADNKQDGHHERGR
jgi:hypothetical protein